MPPKSKEEKPFVHCAHKYKEGCDVDDRAVQPWMMIVGVAALLGLGLFFVFKNGSKLVKSFLELSN